jgi:PIN domain nuclease of toxin-antitoxin system
VNLLLDTHALLWFYLDDPQLGRTAEAAIRDPNNRTFVSPASYWELAIKISVGKYTLGESFDEFIQHAIYDNGFPVLPIEPWHVSPLLALRYHHRDPFDRMLIVQAMIEKMNIVSNDAVFDQYPIFRIW